MEISQKGNGNILIELTPDEGKKYLKEHDVDPLEYIYKNQVIDVIYDELKRILEG